MTHFSSGEPAGPVGASPSGAESSPTIHEDIIGRPPAVRREVTSLADSRRLTYYSRVESAMPRASGDE